MAEKEDNNPNNEFWGRRRKRKWPFDEFEDIFGNEFDKEFERIRRYMEKLMEDLTKGKLEPELRGPYVYGFSMRIGPDGKPRIESFGNRPRKGMELEELKEREPLTDVLEGEEEVTITVELPGVNKEDINLTATEETLTIGVDTEKRKYHRDIELPCKVLPDTTSATYKNGVLDIVIKRAEKKVKKPGKRIEIK